MFYCNLSEPRLVVLRVQGHLLCTHSVLACNPMPVACSGDHLLPVGGRYIERPLLLHGRKFHLRVYALCVGSLTCYAYSEALVLLAGAQCAMLQPPLGACLSLFSFSHLLSGTLLVGLPGHEHAGCMLFLKAHWPLFTRHMLCSVA